MTVVGLPLWWLHWRLIEGHVKRLPVETRSLVRKLYVYVVLALGVGFVAEGAISALSFVVRVEEFDGRPWAAMIVWGGVWAFHWRREASEGQPTVETLALRRIYVYGVAASASSRPPPGSDGPPISCCVRRMTRWRCPPPRPSRASRTSR